MTGKGFYSRRLAAAKLEIDLDNVEIELYIDNTMII